MSIFEPKPMFGLVWSGLDLSLRQSQVLYPPLPLDPPLDTDLELNLKLEPELPLDCNQKEADPRTHVLEI